MALGDNHLHTLIASGDHGRSWAPPDIMIDHHVMTEEFELDAHLCNPTQPYFHADTTELRRREMSTTMTIDLSKHLRFLLLDSNHSIAVFVWALCHQWWCVLDSNL